MYSPRIRKLLEKKGISVGDEISVAAKDGAYSGILMPRAQGEEDVLVLKLQNGYNIGIVFEGGEISLLRKGALRTTSLAEADRCEFKGGYVAILGCGGTIASKVEYRTGAVYPAINAAELRTAFPKLGKIANVCSRQLFSLFSEDMNSTHWKVLADAIEAEIKAGASGVVVMHGTDTMSYSSAAISFMLQKLPVPVVFVGSQRSSDRPSSENEMNMLNAVFSATQDIGEVGVCMHASINDDFCHLHRGTRVRKMHTSRRDAFRSINCPPIAAVDYAAGRFEKLGAFSGRHPAGSLLASNRINSNVAMVYIHPNIKPEMISSLSGYDGVVLLGTGLGHVPVNSFDDKTVKSVLPAIRGLAESGIPVVMSSQTISGRVCLRVYSTGRLLMDAGVIGDGMDWTPEAAYVKLCWALGQTKGVNKVKELMLTDMAGETSARSAMGGYP